MRRSGARAALPAGRRSRARGALLAAVIGCAVVALRGAPPAQAFNPVKPVCNAAGWVSGVAGKACGVVENAPKVLKASRSLLSGGPAQAAGAVLGDASKVGLSIGFTAVAAWVLIGARAAMHEAATLIGKTTSPQLESTWFSSTYWRLAGVAVVLTLPFLFAAAIQALVHGDLVLLVRAALGYLPLALLGVSVAAPVTMLLLAASDQMSAAIAAAGGHDGVLVLDKAGIVIGGISAIDGSPFLAFLVGLLAVAGAVALWLELVMREAAVYVVVLMLPLAFAALVWPARRIWTVRAVEVLVALILSKFAIVTVLSLAAAAMRHGLSLRPGAMIVGTALVILAAFAPWALLRLVPLAELASAAAGSLRSELGAVRRGFAPARLAAGVLEQRLGGDPDGTPAALELADGAREAAAMHTAALRGPQAEPIDTGGDRAADGQAEPIDAGDDRAADREAAQTPAPETDETARRALDADSAPAVAEPERIPGLPRAWQMPNRTWRPITLGLEGMSEPPIGEEEFELASDLDPEDGIPPESEEGTPPESDDPPDPSAPTGRPQ